jgi:hypothetical protein
MRKGGLWKRVSSIGAPRGTGRGHCVTGDFERKVRFLFIRRSCLLGNPRDVFKKRLWKLATLSIGAPLGNLEGCSLTRDFETQYKSAQ